MTGRLAADQAPTNGDAKPVPEFRKNVSRVAIRIVVVLVIVVLLEKFSGGTHWRPALDLIRKAGWPVVAILIPTPVALAFDALGWRQVLRMLGAHVRWLSLTRIRLISEAVVLALPGGAMMAEATKLTFLRRSAGLAPSTTAASLALARVMHASAASIYLGLASVVVATFPAGTLRGRRPALLAVCLATSLFTAGASYFVLHLLREARLATRIADRLRCFGWRRLTTLMDRYRVHIEDIDLQTARFFRAPLAARVGTGGAFLGQWLVECTETALILNLLGADVGIRGALVVDALTSFVRATIVFVPAGLGVQEVSQVSLLHLLGARDDVATATALIFMKRMKELFWIVTGALLAAGTKGGWNSRVKTSPQT